MSSFPTWHISGMVSPGSSVVKPTGLSLCSLAPQRPLNCGAAISGMNCRRKAGTQGGGGPEGPSLTSPLCFSKGLPLGSRTLLFQLASPCSLLSLRVPYARTRGKAWSLPSALCSSPIIPLQNLPYSHAFYSHLSCGFELLVSSPLQALAPHLTAAW